MMTRLMTGLLALGLMAGSAMQAHAMLEQTTDVVLHPKTGCWSNGGDAGQLVVEGDFRAGTYAFIRLKSRVLMQTAGAPIEMSVFQEQEPTLTAITRSQQPTGQIVGVYRGLTDDGFHVYQIPQNVHYMGLFKQPNGMAATEGSLEICVRKRPVL